MLTVERLVAGAAADYDAWVAGLDHGMVYASSAFGAFLADVTGAELVHLVARRDGALVGVLPYAVSTRAGECVVNSLPWYGTHGGACLADPADHAARAALLDTYARDLAACRPLFATTVLTPGEEAHAALYQARLGQSALDTRIGQIADLPATAGGRPEALLERFEQKTRNLVRKACRQNFTEVVTDADEAWAFLIETHGKNLQALGAKPKPATHFAAMRRWLPGPLLRLSLACLDGRPVAALLLLRFARTVEYFVPVIEQQYRSLQPLSFLIWHAMQAAIAAGYRYWNWGGTWPSQRSLHHFKAGWGTRDCRYSYLISASAAGLARFRADPAALLAAFPYFYLYPLPAPATAS